MARRNLLIILMALSLLLGGAVATTNTGLAKTPRQTAVSSQAQKPCTATTDAEIVSAIQEKIKADKRFDNQWKHINVSSTKRVVTITGWVDRPGQFNSLVGYAHRTKCVIRVRQKNIRPHVGCPTGMKQCGDICIERSQDCNLIQ